jgi:UDP-galactopyranose mutase
MKDIYDYVIVGAGMFGSVFAQQAMENGSTCLVIDKRSHIAGNCYTEKIRNIDVHKYGAHIFHTNDERIWNYINRFTRFNNFTNRVKVRNGDDLYSFPINLMTLNQMWGVKTPSEAKKILDQKRINIENPSNLEEWICSQVGEEIYKKFVYGYTKKQWNRHPRDLPSSIIKRIPIRMTYDDNYFDDRFQGIPVDGYTSAFKNMLEGADIVLGVNYFDNKEYYNSLARKKIVYTGAIDEFYEYKFGQLEWRSLRFENEIIDDFDFQGNAVVNYTEESVPFTRILEHKHFNLKNQKNTVITREYPQDWDKTKEKFYPVNDKKNSTLLKEYKSLIDEDKYIFGGRLADYKYYDMHQVIGSALHKYKKEMEQT